MISFKTWKI